MELRVIAAGDQTPGLLVTALLGGPWMTVHHVHTQSRLNDKKHLSQYNVLLYGCSHIPAIRDASCL